jgi:hypothetical protein
LELGLGHCHRTASIWSDSAVTGILKSILHTVTAGKSGVLGLDAGWKSVLVLIKLVDFRHHVANYGGSHFLTEKPLEPWFLLVRRSSKRRPIRIISPRFSITAAL